MAHHNHQRPHRDIDLEPPVPDLAVPQFEVGTVERVDRLDGLLHEYRLAA